MEMSETVFYGSCSEKELIDFSFRVAGIVFRGGMPKRMVALPISKKPHTRRRLIGCENGKAITIKAEKEIVVYHSLKISFYPIDKMRRAWWISKSGNKITFSRVNIHEDRFSIELHEKVTGCQYRGFLQKIGVGITEVKP